MVKASVLGCTVQGFNPKVLSLKALTIPKCPRQEIHAKASVQSEDQTLQ